MLGVNPDAVPEDGRGETTAKILARIALEAGAPEVLGYVVLDKTTHQLNWSDRLCDSVEAAVADLTGPHQFYTANRQAATPRGLIYWEDEFLIRPVLTGAGA